MIAYLRGRVIDIGAETLVLEVNGVGYELYCSASVFSKARFGAEIELYVSMHVKEDGITLFGFDSPKEKELFSRLTSVSGVGPKSAMGVFASMTAFRQPAARSFRTSTKRRFPRSRTSALPATKAFRR